MFLQEEYDKWIRIIDSYSHMQMVLKIESGIDYDTPIFSDERLLKYFFERIQKLGGITYTKEENEEISRQVEAILNS